MGTAATTAAGSTAPARGRPPRMPRDARRAQVLRVAQDLFTAEGYHHVSMDDIAERAEVTKPVLYRHFGSKLDLYLSVVDARGAELLATVDTAMAAACGHGPDQQDASAVVTAVVRAYLDFVDAAGEACALLFESDVMHDVQVRARVEHAAERVGRRIEQVLVGAGVGAEEAAVAAPCVTVVAQQAATRRLREPGGPSAERTAAVVARLVWGGVHALFPPAPVPDGPTVPAPDRLPEPESAPRERGGPDRSTTT